MIHLVLVLVLVLVAVGPANGRPPLPPLPVKDGCFVVSSEVELFRVEGEPVVLHFPVFARVLQVRGIAPPPAPYLISKDNGTGSSTNHSEGRVQHRPRQLWLLPARVSDSGEYTCTYRNESFCISGAVVLQVYESPWQALASLSYPLSAQEGEELRVSCPSVAHFNRTDAQVEWFKDAGRMVLRLRQDASVQQDRDGLTIAAVRPRHAGVYTCRVRVLVNQRLYHVSRVMELRVQGGSDPEVTSTLADLPLTSDPGLSSRPHVYTAGVRPPVIVSPVNGTVYESSHGSGLEMFCVVLTECDVAPSTVVTWLVNGQSVASSYLERRALQGGQRVTRTLDGCQTELRLLVTSITEEDETTRFKCVAQNDGGTQEVVTLLQLEDSTSTWLLVSAVAACCFLAVVTVFLCVLFKPKRKRKLDYMLARQSSTF